MDYIFDYMTLRLIWWGLMGVLFIGFALTDGFDMGVCTLLPFVARSDLERRMSINTIGPVWEGNQVWLILGGGAIFAAWPYVYAVSFSGFYLAMFIVLSALILRPVAFTFRSLRESVRWRAFWDWALFMTGFIPALIFGVAVGNVLQGVPFRLDTDLRIFYTGTLFDLLNPFALLCGLLSVMMLVQHGGIWLAMKAEKGLVRDRAKRYARFACLCVPFLFALCGIWVSLGDIGFQITSEIRMDGASNPLWKEVIQIKGAWLSNYQRWPWITIAPILGFAGVFLSFFALASRQDWLAFLGSKLSVFGIISTVGLSMFPFILPSSLQPEASLLVWDSSSSQKTLLIMLFVTIVFLPIVLLYTGWVFRVLWGRVTQEDIKKHAGEMY